MGNPRYKITGGSIFFKGKDITQETADKRANEGMFLSFQEPLEVPGLTVSAFIRNALQQRKGSYIKLWDFKKELDKNLKFLDMDPAYSERSLNVGFSGGEKKKTEILQLMMLRPTLAILDETDSGLDVDAVRTVSKGVEEFQKDRSKGLLIITHNAQILESLQVDYTHVMVEGRIVKTGGGELVEEISRTGFEPYIRQT